MDSPNGSDAREETAPFLLKLFHRTGTFHRPDEFSSSHDLPAYTTVYAWSTATLRELTHLLAGAAPSVLPNPAIGTRVAYRLLYHDTRGNPSAPRLATQELGSVVVGDGGPGVLLDDDKSNEDPATDEGRLTTDGAKPHMVGSEAEADKTLADARFVVGDFLSVAILPPSAVDGSVQPVPTTRGTGRGASGPGQARGGGGSSGGDQGGFGDSGRYGRAMGGLMGGDRRGFRGDHAVPPVGEWRRGERLPDVPPSRGRGRRRW